MKKKVRNEHYVNNKDFSKAVMEYVVESNQLKEEGKEPNIIPNYIGECFLKICHGLSKKGNFVNYTYRDEMVMDAVENCVKAISNFNINAATRTGNPNAFSYFTKIAYYAFLRRISKEKKQQEIREKFIEQAGVEDFSNQIDGNTNDLSVFVDSLKRKLNQHKSQKTDNTTNEKVRSKRNLENFM